MYGFKIDFEINICKQSIRTGLLFCGCHTVDYELEYVETTKTII